MGLAFIPAIAGWVGYQCGAFFDARLHTTWMQVAGMVLGLALGIWDMLRHAERIEKSGKRD